MMTSSRSLPFHTLNVPLFTKITQIGAQTQFSQNLSDQCYNPCINSEKIIILVCAPRGPVGYFRTKMSLH